MPIPSFCVPASAQPVVSAPRMRRGAIAGLVLTGVFLLAVAAAVLAAEPMGLSRLAARVQMVAAGASYHGTDSVILQSGPNDCGPAALANMILVLGQTPPSKDSLAVLAGTGPTGTWASGLIRAAAVLGLDLAFVRVSSNKRRHVPVPFIAWVRNSHFVTVSERSADAIYMVLDPQAGRFSIDEKQFHQIWSGEAIVLAERTERPVARVAAGLFSQLHKEKAK